MSVIGELLFWSGNGPALSDVLSHNLTREVPAKVDRLPQKAFEKTDDEVVALLLDDCRAEPIVLRLDEADAEVTERGVEVQSVFGERATIPGLRVAKVIPFSGEAGLFKLQPSTFNLSPPYGEVRGDKLVIGMTVSESQSEEAMRYIERTQDSINEYLQWQRGQLEEHNRQLPGMLMQAIQRRRASLGKASDLAARLRGQ